LNFEWTLQNGKKSDINFHIELKDPAEEGLGNLLPFKEKVDN
jgi:hypothetical protein